MESIKINLVPSDFSMPVCHATQYDDGREIMLELFDEKTPYFLSDETIELDVKKLDGNVVTTELDVVPGERSVIMKTTEQMCAVAGRNLCTLKVQKDGTTIYTKNFYLSVQDNATEGGIESESEINNLETQIAGLVEDAVENQYDSENVIFDSEPTEGHGTGYTVSSAGIKAAIDAAGGNVIDDTTSANNKTYSSNKINAIVSGLIDDSEASEEKAWSSEKTKETIDDVQDKLDSIEIECFNKVTHGGQARQDIDLTFTNGYYPEAKSGEINLLNNVVDVKYAVCDVVAGETVHIHAQNNWQVRAYLFANASNNAISWNPSGSVAPAIFDDDVVVPENATKLYVMGKVATDVYVYRYVDLPITIGYEVDIDSLITVLKHGAGYINASYSSNNLTISKDNVSIVAGLNSSSNSSFSFSSIYGKTANDDVCPVRINNAYVGGNHGHPFVINVESTSAHGKTEADIGSVYVRSDDNTLEYVILAIVDTTHLKLIRKDGSLGYINPSLSFSFIHSSGGTHTDDITVSAYTTMQQLYPSINNKSISVYADKDSFITGSKKCQKVTIAEVYNIMKPKAIADYLIANVGDNTNSSYYDDAISGLCKRTTVYEIYSDLSIVISDYLLTLDTYTLTYLGIVQSQYLGTKFYVPYTTYSGVQTFSSNITLDNTVWANASKAPHKYFQVSNDNDKTRGHLLLYPYFALGKDRKDILGSDGNAGILEGATHKFYPRFYSDNESQSVDTMIGGYAIRVPFEFSQNGTFAFEYEIGGKKYIEVECLTEGSYEVDVGTDNNVIVEVINSQNATLNSMCIVNGKILVKSLGNASLTLEVN